MTGVGPFFIFFLVPSRCRPAVPESEVGLPAEAQIPRLSRYRSLTPISGVQNRTANRKGIACVGPLRRGRSINATPKQPYIQLKCWERGSLENASTYAARSKGAARASSDGASSLTLRLGQYSGWKPPQGNQEPKPHKNDIDFEGKIISPNLFLVPTL